MRSIKRLFDVMVYSKEGEEGELYHVGYTNDDGQRVVRVVTSEYDLGKTIRRLSVMEKLPKTEVDDLEDVKGVDISFSDK